MLNIYEPCLMVSLTRIFGIRNNDYLLSDLLDIDRIEIVCIGCRGRKGGQREGRIGKEAQKLKNMPSL